MTVLLSYFLFTVSTNWPSKSFVSDVLPLGLFLKTLTADGQNSLRNGENLTQPTQMQLSKNLKSSFSEYFAQFLESRQILNILKTKTTLLPYVF